MQFKSQKSTERKSPPLKIGNISYRVVVYIVTHSANSAHIDRHQLAKRWGEAFKKVDGFDTGRLRARGRPVLVVLFAQNIITNYQRTNKQQFDRPTDQSAISNHNEGGNNDYSASEV